MVSTMFLLHHYVLSTGMKPAISTKLISAFKVRPELLLFLMISKAHVYIYFIIHVIVLMFNNFNYILFIVDFGLFIMF
jgi:hypothetical protein